MVVSFPPAHQLRQGLRSCRRRLFTCRFRGVPPELDRVLRDYERNWKASDGTALSELFTDDGFINRNGWIRGRDAIRQAYARSGGDLRLRAIAFATGDTVGYIVGGYRYGEAATDGGKFILTLRRAPRGDWKIAADLDAANRQ